MFLLRFALAAALLLGGARHINTGIGTVPPDKPIAFGNGGQVYGGDICPRPPCFK